MNLNDLFTEEKVRLDPKCWTGKKIGNPKTKMKGGTRVNNCVPAESVNEMDKSQTPPGRDSSNDSDAGKKEYTAKATTAKKVAKDGEKILNKELNKKQGVAEGSSLVDRVQQIIEKNHQDGVWAGQDLLEFIREVYEGRIPDEEEFYDDIDALEYEDNFFNELVQVGAFKQGMAEGWKSALGAAAMAGTMALGAGGANARVMPGDDPAINRLTGKPIATQQATDTAPARTDSTSGFSKEYLQKAANPDRFGRYLISIEKAQELLKNMQEGALNEKSTSQAQFRTMAAAAHDPKFAKKVGISRDVAKEFHGADRKQDYADLPKKADEGKSAPKEKEADYGDDYQAMVARVKKLAGLGPLKTVYDPQKRVYRNVPTAVQPKKWEHTSLHSWKKAL